MTTVSTALQYTLEFLAVVGTGYFAISMWRRRTEPAARALVAVAVIMLATSVAHVAVIHQTFVAARLETLVWTGAGRALWLGSVVVGVTLGGGFWFLFTLQYTGRGGRLVPLTATGLVGFWLLELLFARYGTISPPAEATAETNMEIVGFLGMFLMSALAIVGALLVLTTSLDRNAVRFREGLTLALAGALLAFTPIVAETLVRPNTVPAMLTLTSGIFILAIHRYPTFAAPPAARIAGRDMLIEEMDDPFVVVDLDDRIRDLNRAGERYFNVEKEEVLGATLDALVPPDLDPEAVAAADQPVEIRTSAGATLAVSGDRITDARDRSFGHLLVCRDVTERDRRRQRLGVLTQLLTGAVAEQMTTVAESAAAVTPTSGRGESNAPDPSAVGRSIRTTTTELLDLVAWTREIERTLAESSPTLVDPATVVHETALAISPDEDVDLTLATDDSVPMAAMDRAVLQTVLEILLTESLEQARETVEVAVVETAGRSQVEIVDDRPVETTSEEQGELADKDRRRSQSEVAVELSRVATRQVGAELSTDVTEPGTCRIALELPRLDEGGVAGPATDSASEAAATAPASGEDGDHR